jgi:hypothetical protein
MCNSDYEGMMPARYLRHGSQPEMEAVIRDMPQLQPFWAAGFSFSKGLFFLFFLDSTARKNMYNFLYKKQDYLFYAIIV